MPFETVNNLQVYYEVHGEGDVIILMHHGFGCTRIWNTLYRLLWLGATKSLCLTAGGLDDQSRE